jgi:hypothetical protein
VWDKLIEAEVGRGKIWRWRECCGIEGLAKCLSFRRILLTRTELGGYNKKYLGEDFCAWMCFHTFENLAEATETPFICIWAYEFTRNGSDEVGFHRCEVELFKSRD